MYWTTSHFYHSSQKGFLHLVTFFHLLVVASGDLIISGVGSIQGNRFFVEFFTATAISDLSLYGVAVANSGGSSPGAPEYTFPSSSVPAMSFFYITEQSSTFMSSFLETPVTEYHYPGLDLKQGDDTVELYKNNSLLDVFGNYTDGTGAAWDYDKGWAKRGNLSAVPSVVFYSAQWDFSGTDALTSPDLNSDSSIPFRSELEGYTFPTETVTTKAAATQPLTTETKTTEQPTTTNQTTEQQTTTAKTKQTTTATTEQQTTRSETTQGDTSQWDTTEVKSTEQPATTQSATTQGTTIQADTTQQITTQAGRTSKAPTTSEYMNETDPLPTIVPRRTLRQAAAAYYQDTASPVNNTPTEAPYAAVVGGSFLIMLLVEAATLVVLDFDNIVSQSMRAIRNTSAMIHRNWAEIQ